MKQILKKNLITLTLTGALFTTPMTTIFAQSPTASQQQLQRQEERLGTVKQKADTEIAQRIDSLNKLIARIQDFKHITDQQKSTLSQQIQTQITLLNSLKSKIEADTELQTMRTDRNAIFTENRVYMLFIPKMHILAAADRMNGLADLLTQLEAKLQDRINQEKTSGKDVSALETDLNNMLSKIADARTQYEQAENTVTPLVPDAGDKTKMEANKTALLDARAMIKTGEEDLKTTRNDAEQVRNALKSSPSPIP